MMRATTKQTSSACDMTLTGLSRLLTGAVMVLALCLAPAALTGCNTVEGVGEDVEAAGGAIDEAAEDSGAE